MLNQWMSQRIPTYYVATSHTHVQIPTSHVMMVSAHSMSHIDTIGTYTTVCEGHANFVALFGDQEYENLLTVFCDNIFHEPALIEPNSTTSSIVYICHKNGFLLVEKNSSWTG